MIARTPEQLLVAPMWDAVIDIACCRDTTVTHARTVLATASAVMLITTQRVQTQPMPAVVLPLESIPALCRRLPLLVHLLLALALVHLASTTRHQHAAAWYRAWLESCAGHEMTRPASAGLRVLQGERCCPSRQEPVSKAS